MAVLFYKRFQNWTLQDNVSKIMNPKDYDKEITDNDI